MSQDNLDFNWTDIWGDLPKEEKEQALTAFARELKHGTSLPADVRHDFIRKLAKTLHFRPQTLASMNEGALARATRRAMPQIMDGNFWGILFAAHYFANKNRLMCHFLDLCNIEHDERGGVNVKVTPPADITNVTIQLKEEFGSDEVRRYFMVLLLHHRESWDFLGQVLPLLDSNEAHAPTREPEPMPEEEETSAIDGELADSFTQLDRVLIEQVIATAAGEERALFPEQLVDLVETVHALDTRRNRTYFHLGFMNALLREDDINLNRPEMNDPRREWYLAGLLAGLARQRDLKRIDHFLSKFKGDFERAAQTPGGAGASMAKTVFPFLLESNRLHPALALLKGQGRDAGRFMGPIALVHASELLRDNEIAEAKALLSVLHDGLSNAGADYSQEFRRDVRRKLGQAFQAVGELTRAQSLFEDLLEDGSNATPKLLADRGLVEAGFAGLQEVRIEGNLERRKVLLAALEKGKPYFDQAVQQFPDKAHHAHFLIAVYQYLCFMDSDDKGEESIAKAAMFHAESALSGMIGSEESEAFDRIGITGQCRFILAVLRMSTMDESQAPAAMQAWRAIPSHSGKFPRDHLEQFLEWSDLTGSHFAIQIAESIWEARGEESLELFRQQDWVVRSDKLREAFLSAAAKKERPRSERFDLWSFLVPALLQGYFNQLAEEGLDAMEALAEEDSRLAERFSEWLQDVKHYDPAWSEADALRARYKCYNRLGNKDAALATLRNLFHAIKDENPEEAAEIRDLVGEYEGHDQVSDLIVPDSGREDLIERIPNIEQRLKEGEQVKVLFIGGNEIQARYDEQIQNTIRKDWPKAEVVFEHTGWSSNWGHEVDRLKRLAKESDAVVLMSMMRTMLGRTMRAALNDPPRPWVPCTGTGRQAVEKSVRKAIIVGLMERADQ